MRKITVPKLKKKLDTVFSLKVRERDKFTCQKCGKQHKQVHCAHIFSRNNLSVRYEMQNCITLCYFCHLQWAHRFPVEFTLWIKSKIGERLFEKLRKQSQIIINDPRTFLDEKSKELCG